MKCFLLLILIAPLLYSQSPFSTDSALSYLKTISFEIGPRHLGSLNEMKAMNFALSKFKEFGLDEVYFMQMKTAQNDITKTIVNTNSGIVVGTLRGQSNKIILIGAHIDSASPFIPGATDNGSGSATVIELARILSKEKHYSTIVFCLFGGEEAGLCGSSYFVKNFPQIDSVVLMLNIDMANGSEILIPTINSPTRNTPIWLVQAAYEEFAKLKHSDLTYLTHFFTGMSILPGGGVGSDHEPFLRKGIPAIDFTSDINDPIHTLQDDFEHFKPSGLKRSGDLVYALVNRFDKNIPENGTNDYYLLQIGKRALILPIPLLSIFIILSIILSLFILFVVRKRRTEIEKSQKQKIPALKLLLISLLIQIFVWFSENLVAFIKGIRFAWITFPDGYYILGFLSALLAICLSLRFTPKLKLSHDPYRWLLRSMIFLYVFTGLLALTNVKIALYPSIAIFFLSLAMLVHQPWLKFLLWLISPHFMFRLILSEGFTFLGRLSALHSIQPTWINFVLHALYIIFFALWSFPFLAGFAAIYFDSGTDLLKLNFWKTRKGLQTISATILICLIVLLFYPSYSDEWRKNIIVEQSINLNTKEGKIKLKSSEYLKDLKIHIENTDTNISTWDREILLKKFTFIDEPWIKIERTKDVKMDSNTTTFNMLMKVNLKHRPYMFKISYSSGKNKIEDAMGDFITNITPHSISMSWESLIDTTLTIPIYFKVVGADSINETIEAKFIEQFYPIKIEANLTNIITQTSIERTEIIKP